MTEKEIIKLTAELEKSADFWMNRKNDSHGVNFAASTAISAVRQALIDALMSDNELNQPSGSVVWESVEGCPFRLQRARVNGGWLYQNYAMMFNANGDADWTPSGLAFVPDSLQQNDQGEDYRKH